jgi:hypothetical protein
LLTILVGLAVVFRCAIIWRAKPAGPVGYAADQGDTSHADPADQVKQPTAESGFMESSAAEWALLYVFSSW